MGTVYKANDLELNRTVAIKVIRPGMASRPEVLERFKREILLASQVTHKNVLRIHDLGEADDVRFISMNYVEGENLKSLLGREGPLSVDRALPLIREICEALQAAHEAGVVHRDLKPQNILVDLEGHAYIADFGISRSLESGGTMTDTGTVLGTVDYMSPEQARGETPDHRGDIYSLGVILYEIFSGSLPFQSASPLSVMMKRVHMDAPSLRAARPEIPAWLSAVVARALERQPALRYQRVADLLADLDRHRASLAWRRLLRPRALATAAAVLLAVVAAAAGTLHFLRTRQPISVPPKASLALLPFRNATGDPRYDWTRTGLPDLLRSDLLQARGLRLVGDERVREILEGLKLDESELLRPATLQRISNLLGVENIALGSLLKAGEQFRIEASLLHAGTGSVSPGEPIRVEGKGEESLFLMVDEMTHRIRDELGVSRGWGEADRGASELSTRSVEALSLYSEGRALARAGNQIEATRRLEQALEKDPEFSVARVLLAETYDRLGYSQKAASAAERAAQGLRTASPYEAARIRAVRARLANDPDGAERAYQELCDISPHSAEALFELASAQEKNGHLGRALESIRRGLALDPKNPAALYALGRVQEKLGDPVEALKEYGAALSIHLETGNEEGRASVLNGMGNAYHRLGRYDEALRNFEDALEIRKRIGDRRGVGVALNNIALIHRSQGHYDEAIRQSREALKVIEEIGDRRFLAEVYSGLGETYEYAGRVEDALRCYQESLKIVREVGDEASLAQNLSSMGYVNGILGNYVEAFFFHKEALAKRRTIGDKRDILQSLIYIAAVEQVQGRYEEALKYYLEGQSLAREIGEKAGEVVLALNLSNIHEEQGEYAAALALLADADARVGEVGDKNLTATCKAYLGSARRHLGDYAGAEEALGEALRLAREMNSAALVAETLTYQGDLLLARGQREQASSILREAVSKATAAKDRRLLLMARLHAAETGLSVSGLEAVGEEARSAGLLPLVGMARLALARTQLRAGRAVEALRSAERAIETAAPLRQRDVLFEAHRLAAVSLLRQGKTGEALERCVAALTLLEELRQGLKEPLLGQFLGRTETVEFGREAAELFSKAQRPQEAERLRALLRS